MGVISRSGTLTYQIVNELTLAGLGQTTVVGMGGDPVHGVGFLDCLALFDADPATRAVVLIGEIGGDDEERAAAWVREHSSTPVVAYLAGFSAPPGKTMGHAGAIVSGGRGTAAAKAEASPRPACRWPAGPTRSPGSCAPPWTPPGSSFPVPHPLAWRARWTFRPAPLRRARNAGTKVSYKGRTYAHHATVRVRTKGAYEPPRRRACTGCARVARARRRGDARRTVAAAAGHAGPAREAPT